MKDFEKKESGLLKPEMNIVQQTQKEFRYKGSIRRRTGLNLYSYDPVSGELNEVEVQRSLYIGINKKVMTSNKVTTYNPNNIYFFALNLMNAKKKVEKLKTIYYGNKIM